MRCSSGGPHPEPRSCSRDGNRAISRTLAAGTVAVTGPGSPAVVRRLLLALVVAAVVGGCGSGPATNSPAATAGQTGGDPAAIARTFIDALARGDTAAAQSMEDQALVSAAPAAKLGQLWRGFVAQYGAFRSVGSVTTAVQAPYTIAAVATAFANEIVTLNVTVEAAGRVAGLHVAAVAPAPSAAPASPAAYVNPASFTERSVSVGKPPWVLPGTLSMPNGPGPFPAVILVAGSGPQDRDETIGPNKPLRDLAWGLATAGIAVLRYDKRTLVYAKAMAAELATLTVRQETMDDAVAAIALLRATQKVDPARVFLVGHSLGAYLAPRIAAEVPGELRGLVMLEASSTPLPELILDQAEYLASLPGSAGPDASGQLQTLRTQVALAESPDLSPSTPPSALPLGIPAAYWLDLRTYHPLTVVAALHLPIFFSQGGRDYQVPPSELTPWQRALAGRTDVTFRTYPSLDHLLFAGTGPSTPAEYTVPAHVAPQLVADVAAWISDH